MDADEQIFTDLRVALPLLAAALAVPWLMPGRLGPEIVRIATLTLVYMLLSQGLNVVSGFFGRIDLGFAGFFAIGAYTAARLSVDGYLNFWLVLVLATLHGAGWGWLRELLARRLSGYGFALFTLAFTALILLVIRNEGWLTGGAMGLSNLARPRLGDYLLERGWHFYYLALALLLVVLAVLRRILKSRYGLAWQVLGEDEEAAGSVGIDAVRYRLAASALSGAIGALAGAFYVVWLGFVHPDMFTFRESVTIFCLVALGGPGTLAGPLLGALLLIPLGEISGLWLPAGLGPVRYLGFALLLVLLLRWRPAGLVSAFPVAGEGEERHG